MPDQENLEPYGISVLCVDDEPALLEITRSFLEITGNFSVDSAESAKKAFEKLEQKQYDVIVSDYEMSGTNGIQFLQKLRSEGKKTPFIIFTGKGREEIVIQALNSGADFYLQKGGDPKSQYVELVHKIHQAVQRQRANEALKETEQRLSDIINFLPDATFAIDQSGRVIAWNRAIEEMTGVLACNMLGKGNYEYAIPFYGAPRKILIDLIFEHDGVIAEHYSHIVHEKGTLIAETPLPHPMGKPHFLMGKASPLYNRHGTIVGAIESIRDITELRQASEELRAGEEKYRIVVENSHDAIYIYRDNRFLFVNSRISELTGYSHGELMEKDVWHLIHPDDRIRLMESGKRRVSGEQFSSIFSARILTKTGDIREGEFSVGHIVYQGEPAILGIVRDITERKQIEQELRESVQKYRGIIEATPDIIWEIDTSGNLIYISPQSEKILGYSASDLIGKPFFSIVREEDIPRIVSSFSRHVENTEALATFEVMVKHHSGHFLTLVIHSTPFFSPDGTLNGFRGICHDITDRTRKAEAFRMAEEEYRTIIDAVPAIIWYVDAQGNVIRGNKTASDLLGLPLDELVGKTLWDLFPKVEADKFFEDNCEVIEFRKPKTGIIEQYTTADGLKRWAHTDKIPDFDSDGNVIGVIILVNDITDFKRASDALHQVNLKLNLLSGITRHDVLNQLNIVIGCLSLLEENFTKSDNVKFFEMMKKSTANIHQLIASTKIYEDIGVKSPQWQNVHDTIRKALHSASPGQISLSIDTEDISIFADPLLERVFLNLIENTRNHGEHATRIKFSYFKSGRNLVLVYEDNGVGINASTRQHLFERGYGKNTGYGLFLIREILGITGITIEEHGEPGKGARFEILVPGEAYRLTSGE